MGTIYNIYEILGGIVSNATFLQLCKTYVRGFWGGGGQENLHKTLNKPPINFP